MARPIGPTIEKIRTRCPVTNCQLSKVLAELGKNFRQAIKNGKRFIIIYQRRGWQESRGISPKN
jgi:hypothetical protein